MKLASLQIERFGARSNLKLEDLSEHLNVVYGPNGSGKTTIISFIRWVIFGTSDDSSRRFAEGGYRTGGSLEVVDGHRRRRRISRYRDGARTTQGESYSSMADRTHRDERALSPRYDSLQVTTDSGELEQGDEHRRLTSADLNEYRCLFSFGFDQPPSLEQLISVAAARQFALTYDEAQVQRLRDLRARLHELRSGSAGTGESLESLVERRRQVSVEIADTERARGEQLQRIQVECDTLSRDIGERRRQLDELKAVLSRIDSNIEQRQRELDQAAHEVQQTRQRWSEERQQEVLDIDYQLQQWHNVLDAIRSRNESLRSQLATLEPQAALQPVTDESELRVFLRSLGYRIDDIDNDMRDLDWLEGQEVEKSNSDYLRSILGAALNTMRDDVQRLSRELQRQQHNVKYHDGAREQESLRRCESELGSLIETLSKRRQTLTGHSAFEDVNWASYTSSTLPAPNAHPRSSELLDTTESWYEDSPGRPWFDSVERAAAPVDLPTSRVYGVADPVLEARLAHLAKRRDQLLVRIRDWQHDVSASEHRLETLLASRDRLEETLRLEALRRELETLDQRIRDAEAYSRRRVEIESLERQIAELERTLGPSDILREAGGILTRMSGGAYRAIRINERREVFVEDDHGRHVSHREVSRGSSDQVYLSVALALIGAYRRKGIQLPVVLNDIFINIDDERAHATAEVLSHFAAQGHQVILFTRHEHVVQRFQALNARSFTLRERQVPVQSYTPAAPSVPYVAPIPFRPDSQYGSAPSEFVRPATARPSGNGHYLDQVPPSSSRPTQDYGPPRSHSTVTTGRPSQPNYDWVAQWDTLGSASPAPVAYAPTVVMPNVVAAPVVQPMPVRPMPERSIAPPAPVARPALNEHTRLTEIDWLDPQHVARLHDIGISVVLQFLEMEPEDAQDELAAFSIPAPLIFRWQSEMSLQCYVGLSANDAALLVACGVDDPEELTYIDVSELHRRIGQYLNSSDSRSQFGSLARYERSRLSRWIHTARNSHYRRQHQRWNRYRSSPGPDRIRMHRDEPRRAESPRRAETRSSETRRVIRAPQPKATERIVTQEPAVRNIQPKRTRDTIRFYLELSDPVVDAPSIGPKTAERFHAVGVTTVRQLLELDPTATAEKIGYRRITAELIRTWQLQTTLVCRVPGLRGHDAQILVACDVPHAESLAKMAPEALLAEVNRFVKTAEGKRVIRSAKSPDLHEVSNWIEWSTQARDLGIRATA